LAQGVDDGGVAVEQTMGEEPLAEVEPDAFDGVEFRRVGGSGRRVTFLGTRTRREPCQPAWSSTRTAWTSGARLSAKRLRNRFMARIETRGRTSAKP
jgi:hypothetical protein